MSKIPAKPQEIFKSFTADCRKCFGDDLVSIILYGSGARGEYVPKRSDINFMVVLSPAGINSLSRALPLVAAWKKRMVATPLFITKNYIETSLDTFPIEFLNFKAAYTVVDGEDVLQDIMLEKKFVRLQCERELKGKLLQLRQRFLETGGHRRGIGVLIALSLPTFFSIFEAILFLKGRAPVSGTEKLIEAIALEAGLDRELFLQLAAVRNGRRKLSDDSAPGLMESYIGEIKKLASFADQLQIS